MSSQTTAHVHMTKPQCHRYSVSSIHMLPLFMNIEMSLLIVGLGYQSGRTQQSSAMPLYISMLHAIQLTVLL